MKKKHLIKELPQFGITSSYDEHLLFKGSLAYASMKHGYQTVRSATENHRRIQGVADSINSSGSSPNGLKQTQIMAVIMTQEHISTNMPDSSPDYIHRKSKQDL